jgi:hypothetical protein
MTKFIAIVTFWLSICSFYLLPFISNRVLRLCLKILLAISLVISLTFALSYNILDITLALFLVLVLSELAELKIKNDIQKVKLEFCVQ